MYVRLHNCTVSRHWSQVKNEIFRLICGNERTMAERKRDLKLRLEQAKALADALGYALQANWDLEETASPERRREVFDQTMAALERWNTSNG